MAGEPKAIEAGKKELEYDPEGVDALLKAGEAKGGQVVRPGTPGVFRDPKRAPLLDAYGSPPEWLANDLLKGVSGDNLAVLEASVRKLAEVRRELEGPNSTPTERLLAERTQFAGGSSTVPIGLREFREPIPGQADYQQRKIDPGLAGSFSAIKTLATVRKLALPAFQVSIGVNQVNTIGQPRP